jgi:hypothetical protein
MAITKSISNGCLQDSTVAGGAGAYNNVSLMNALSASFSMKNIDVTTFLCGSTVYPTRATGMQKIQYSASGFWDDYGDTNGQNALMDNVVEDIELWFKFLYDGTHFLKSRVEIDGMDIKTTPDGTVDVTFSAQSTGAITSG